ncbi:unnamed protein product [Colletotrichum noveboracense]|uniref:Uncharacterized protein n=1 Tax=Colletotrichum noveboracense TaxID=2664923 RepID=A0A9W4WCI2_9PEZI|nr:unnamed protein product [Colletotrichum noveboracense]
MPHSAADRNLWLAYANAVKEAIQFEPTYGTALYLSSKAQKGPFASPRIPLEYTNAGIYEAANNHLRREDLFYHPNSRDSYVKSLRTFLQSVDAGARGDVHISIESCIRELEDSLEIYEKSADKARRTFKKHSDVGMTGDSTFSQWHQTNAPAFCNSIRDVEVASEALLATGSVLIGPRAQKWNQDLRKLLHAMMSEQDIPGMTMPIDMDFILRSGDKAQKLLNKIKLRKKASPSKVVACVPAFYCPDYENVVRDWIGAGRRDEPGDRLYVRYAEGEIADEGGFGHEQQGDSFKFTYPPWLSFYVDGHELPFKAVMQDSDVDITISFDNLRIVKVAPGAWNLDNLSSSYPRMKAGLSTDTYKIAQPHRLVVINNLVLRILFSGRVVAEVAKQLKRIQYYGGFLNVLGVSAAIDQDRSTDQTSHTATWNAEDGVLEVIPTIDGGFATFIGTVGKAL